MADAIIRVEYDLKIKTTETIDVGIDGVTNQDHTLEIADMSGALSPTSTVAATKVFKDQVSLSGGAVTIDLTALVRTNLPNVDGTGLKVQAFSFLNLSTNANSMTVVDGASNGYDIWGAASGSVTFGVGVGCAFFFNDKLDDIASADATIDVSGTGSQTFWVHIVMG